MSGTSTDNAGGIERRTLVRAGAWSVPVVAVAVAAPAFACSPKNSLVLGGFTANYRNYLNMSTVDPTLIDVSSTVTNTGSQPTNLYTRTLRIPGNLFDSVLSSTPDDYSAPLISGNPTTGWVLTYTRTNALGVGLNKTDTFNAVLTVGNTASPFRGWQGPAFPMTGEVSGGSTCNGLNYSDPVETSANTTLEVITWRAFRDGLSLWVGTNAADGPATSYVQNIGRKAVGPITLSVTVPDTAGRYNAVGPLNPTNVASGWEFVSRTPPAPNNATGDWVYMFRTVAPSAAYFAPDDFSATATDCQTKPFRALITLAGGSNNNPTTVNITAQATAPGGSAKTPAASDNAEG